MTFPLLLMACGGGGTSNDGAQVSGSQNAGDNRFDMADYLINSQLANIGSYHKTFGKQYYYFPNGSVQVSDTQIEEEKISVNKYRNKVTTTYSGYSNSNEGFVTVNAANIVEQYGLDNEVGRYTYTTNRYVSIGGGYSGKGAYSRSDVGENICILSDHYDSIDMDTLTSPKSFSQDVYSDVVQISCIVTYPNNAGSARTETYFAKNLGPILHHRKEGAPASNQVYLIYEY